MNFLISIPEFVLCILIILSLSGQKRYYDFRNIFNVIRFAVAVFGMYIVTIVVRQISLNFIFTSLTQTVLFFGLFRVLYFSSKKVLSQMTIMLKYIVIQLTLEMVFVVFVMIFKGNVTADLDNDLYLKFYYSIPVRIAQFVIFLTLLKLKNLDFLAQYKKVKNLCYVVEMMLICVEILIIYAFLGFSAENYTVSQKVIMIGVVGMLVMVNVLYLYSLNLLAKELYNRLYPKIIMYRERGNL
ncbi:MAG: hypothetical protein N2645_00745 [Clostridia bacterium]|nr:hypothetical protein [Clostridia bacterium]